MTASNLQPLLTDHRAEFANAMSADGAPLEGFPIDDGCLHRFRVQGDKSRNRNGWYCLHGDGIPAGSYGSWKTGESFTWCSKSQREMSEAERAANQKRIEAAKQQRTAERARVQREAATACTALWSKANATVSAQHPYLVEKGIPAYQIRQHKQALLIPVRDQGGHITSLQFINPNGSKRFKSGGKIRGCYTTVGTPTETVYIAEGYATAVTVHQATDCIVVVAFNAGNLAAVTEIIRRKYPDKTVVICADNDTASKGNPGITAAKAVSAQYGVGWTYPDLGGAKCDFNDLLLDKGIDAVADQITDNLKQPTTSKPDGVIPIVDESRLDEDVEIERLAQLSVIEYERAREDAAKALGSRSSILDKLVATKRKELESDVEDAHGELSGGIEPWESPVTGQQLAEEIRGLLRRYTILPDGGYEAVTLWAIGSYVYNGFRIYPKLCLSSPEKRCGKTTLLETIAAIVCRSLMASNMSPAVIFRAVEAWKPALLIDEGDTFLHGNEELRGIINSGHTRSTAFVLRVEEIGGVREPKRFSTWAPMAIAMIKTPPDTILDRSVLIPLRRKMPNESVTRLPLDLFNDCRDLRRKIQRWADDHIDTLAATVPCMPNVGSDRAEDNWWPLIAIAYEIGGDWPDAARKAMTTLESGKNGDDEGIGPMILADIRQAFEDNSVEKLASQDLVEQLIEMEDRPWAEWRHGKPISKMSLSRLLKPYGVRPKTIRLRYETKKGYEQDQFSDAFSRYLAVPRSLGVTPSHPSNHPASSVTGCNIDDPQKNQGVTLQPSNHAGCDGVTAQVPGVADMNDEKEELEL